MNQRIEKMMLQKAQITEQQLKKAQAEVRKTCGFNWMKLASVSFSQRSKRNADKCNVLLNKKNLHHKYHTT